MRGGRTWRSVALLALWCPLLWALPGCAGGPGGASAPVRGEPSTASDQTDAERRARVRLELAAAYFGHGQTDTALDEVKLALQAYPPLGDAYNLRGLIYAAMNEDVLAEDSFRRAAQMNPRDGGVLHNHAWFLCQRGRHAEAQRLYDAALAIPQYRDRQRTLLARGVCYARDGQLPEAEAALMRAHELDPSNPGVGFSLAELLYQRGQYERARFYIGRVNDMPSAANAQSLWLAVRVAQRLGLANDVRLLGERLRTRFPQSPEATSFERGRFDD